MQPISPVIPGLEAHEIVFAKDQPQYLQLPALRTSEDGMVTTRWRLSWKERLSVLFGGSLYLQCLTFNRPLQPLKPSVAMPAEFRPIIGKKR